MMRSTLRTSMRYATVFLTALLLALIISNTHVFGVTACSLEPNTYDPAQFDRVLENFEQTSTLRLEGPDWDKHPGSKLLGRAVGFKHPVAPAFSGSTECLPGLCDEGFERILSNQVSDSN